MNKSLFNLFTESLKKTYSTEKVILLAIQEMRRGCSTETLDKILASSERHATRRLERLRRIGVKLETDLDGGVLPGAEGIAAEAKELIIKNRRGYVADLELLILARKLEHYGMVHYDALWRFAEALHLSDEADLLDQSLEEEEQIDMMLLDLGTTDMYPRSATEETVN